MGLSSTANKKSKDKVLGLRAVEAETTIHGARGHVGYGRNRRKSEAHSYVAPRVDHQVSKPWTGRVLYTLALLNIVVWLPVWLKLISIERQYLPNTRSRVFNGNVFGVESAVLRPRLCGQGAREARSGGGPRRHCGGRKRRLRLDGASRESAWYDGTYIRYWDCCKPSCSWNGKGDVDSPVRACSAETGKVTDATSRFRLRRRHGGVLHVEPALDLIMMACRWASRRRRRGATPMDSMETRTAASASSWSGPVSTSYGGGAHSDIVGKSHIIQVTNIGYDVTGDHSFDLQIPGGGQGIFDSGCAAVRRTCPPKARPGIRKTSIVATTMAAATI